MTDIQYRITAPQKGFTGQVAGVAFADGKTVCGPGVALTYFRTAGYGIEPIQPDPEPDPEPAVPEPEPIPIPNPARAEPADYHLTDPLDPTVKTNKSTRSTRL